MSNKQPELTAENLVFYSNLMAGYEGIEIKGKTMPYTSVNGNMFSFLKAEGMGLRLAKEDREQFIREHNSRLYETFGTVMKEYVTVPLPMLVEADILRPYIGKSLEYANTLKPKGKK